MLANVREHGVPAIGDLYVHSTFDLIVFPGFC